MLPDATPRPRPRILLAGTAEPMLTEMEETLQDRGYQVLRCSPGLPALQTAGAVHPDLIVLEVAPPAEDAERLATALRADPRTRAIPIVALPCDDLTRHAVNRWAARWGVEVAIAPCDPEAIADCAAAYAGRLPRRAAA